MPAACLRNFGSGRTDTHPVQISDRVSADYSRQQVLTRSQRMCEAMVGVGPATDPVWTRCFRSPIEVHHRLTRGRGGAVLDAAGETVHLIALCGAHHRMADGASAYATGLLVDGMMVRDGTEHYYTGTDPVLRARYGRN